jgi:hypothetical protein
VDTEPPPPGGVYTAETVVRSVPRELLRELNYPLKPPKVPTIEPQPEAPPIPVETLPIGIESDADIGVEVEIPTAEMVTNKVAVPPIHRPAHKEAVPQPPRGLISGWASVCLIFVVAIAVIAVWFSR